MAPEYSRFQHLALLRYLCELADLRLGPEDSEVETPNPSDLALQRSFPVDAGSGPPPLTRHRSAKLRVSYC